MNPSLQRLLSLALERDQLALGRLARLLDEEDPGARRLVMERLYPLGGRAHVVGVTGPPGVGKSTLVSGMVSHLRREGRTVAVLAVDPSSPFSGGAVLGDRVRMQEHATDPGVFIRSLAARGHLGGLSRTIYPQLVLLDAAGFDTLLLETVGVGQDEVEVRELAHSTVLLSVPGLGDGIQNMKAGVLEIADLLVVNKADLPGAGQAARELEGMLELWEGEGWRPRVCTVSATRGEGMVPLMEGLEEHRSWWEESGARRRRALSAARTAVVQAVSWELEQRVRRLCEGEGAAELERVAGRELDPFTVAAAWLSRLDPSGGE